MATLLLVVIYIAFIGLGVPDSLFGTAWPAIYTEFDLPLSSASCVTLLISLCTVLSSLCSARVIHRFGTGRVTVVSTAMTAVALLGFSVSGNLFFLCLFAVPLGLGAGSVDTALNNYVALHYKATHMNFLHCFYGIGISLSPFLMSLAMAQSGGWRGGYQAAFFIQLGIAAIAFLSLPVWKKVDNRRAEVDRIKERTISLREAGRLPAASMVWCAFIGSCAIESTCGTWGSTFLVEYKQIAVDAAAQVITFYYIGMALGRFLSGILSARLSCWKLIRIGLGIMCGAILILLLPLPAGVAGIGLFLIGLGNAPIFPNLIHLTPVNFGKEVSQSVMGTQMVAAYAGVMLAPPIFGLLAQVFGTVLFSYYLLVYLVVLLLAVAGAVKILKRHHRYEG